MLPESTGERPRCAYQSPGNRQCREAAGDDQEFCIFHLPDPAKDRAEFSGALSRLIEASRENLDVEGFVFPIDFAIDDSTPRQWRYINAKNAKFLCSVVCRGVLFNGKLNFSGAIFCGPANFGHAIFANEAIFNDVTFEEKVTFTDVKFSGLALFRQASFYGEVDLRDAQFALDVEFVGAHFKHRVDFSRSLFDGRANFYKVEFSDKATFNNCEFSVETYFENVLFEGEANFKETRFHRPAYFGRGRLCALFNKTDFAPGTSFVAATVSQTEFRNVDLQWCLFADSIGLEQCRFSHVQWNKGSNRRWVLADEVMYLQPEYYRKKVDGDPFSGDRNERSLNVVERVYRALKVNYEASKNFPDAGQFYYGEMEMRRLAKANFFTKTTGSLAGWYWLLSGYGERPRRALASLCAILAITTFIYAWQGFSLIQLSGKPPVVVSDPAQPNARGDGTAKVLSEDVGTEAVMLKRDLVVKSGKWLDSDHVIPIIAQAFLFSVKVAFIKIDAFGQSLSRGTTVTIIFELASAPLVFGLMVLAIRRQVRRN